MFDTIFKVLGGTVFTLAIYGIIWGAGLTKDVKSQEVRVDKLDTLIQNLTETTDTMAWQLDSVVKHICYQEDWEQCPVQDSRGN